MSADKNVLEEIHKAFLSFLKRAEKNADDVLTRTFVDTAPLMDSLTTINSQVIYGRRGTGKTHALKYLARKVAEAGEYSVYIDLRSIGSNGALYADASRPIVERGIRLVLDVLEVVADELYAIALAKIDTAPHPDQITSRIDELMAALSDVKIVGEQSKEVRSLHEDKEGKSKKIEMGAGIDAGKSKFGSLFSFGKDRTSNIVSETTITIKGAEERHIEFGKVQGAFKSLIEVLGKPRIWLLIDEWSEVPVELQPYLADLFRRTVLPLNYFVLKIAAIEHRSRFYIPKSAGEYIGLELGADVSADVNLDDFLVFENSQERAVNFVKLLLFSHYQATGEKPSVGSADELIRIAFTQAPVFAELVRAAEGVPRDAINLAAKLASKSYGKAATMVDVRTVARDWYQQDKASILKSWPELDRLMTRVIDTVIGQRRARAFLFQSNLRNENIERLFDGRIIHLLKRNISSKEDPGVRYDVYKIDYGCYVDLINTKQAPESLFSAILADGVDEVSVEVPQDDYRSIRRAILTPKDLEQYLGAT